MIINIEVSPIRSRRYRVYFIDGSRMDIGGATKLNEYVDTGKEKDRARYYNTMSEIDKEEFLRLRKSRIVLEAFILNGPTTSIIKNINYLNEMLSGD